MSEQRDPVTDQVMPTPNNEPRIHDLVAEDVQRRRELGERKYRTPLQPFNGRDAVLDAYEEVLDLAVYLRQIRYERDHMTGRYETAFGWLCMRVDTCTCDGGGELPHRPECGLEPIEKIEDLLPILVRGSLSEATQQREAVPGRPHRWPVPGASTDEVVEEIFQWLWRQERYAQGLLAAVRLKLDNWAMQQ